MVQGTFKSFRHEHYFESVDGHTLMKDVFVFESPFRWLGKSFNWLVLKRYMTKLLEERNRVIRNAAEKL
jgi:ligand-binding SRPBCC domain-containing protein